MKTLTLKIRHKDRFNLSSFPNFSKTGSILGMKEKYYGKDALLVKCGSYIYKVDKQTYNKIRTTTKS